MKVVLKIKIFRNYGKYNFVKFCEDFRGVNWDGGLNFLGIVNENDICLYFLRWLIVTFRLFSSEYVVQIIVWMIGEIKKDIRQRDYFLKKVWKLFCDEDWRVYKLMRNRVTNLVKKVK